MSTVFHVYRSLALCVGLVLSGATAATPITPNAGWHGFCFLGPGSYAEVGCQNQGVGAVGNPITVDLLEPGLIKITDAFDAGDSFRVYIDSVFSFITAAPGVGSYTEDPDVAFASGYFSAGSAFLSAGAHTIEIIVSASPFGAGGAYVAVETHAAPLPATFFLLGVGLAVLGWTRRELV
ncbi:MAG: PEP-CTERM sorting domain-containing protein [Halioglobus sp.]